MKKLLLFTLAACLSFSVASADPQIFYGTTDGSAFSVGLDKDVSIPCWVQNDPTNVADSIGFMHNALGTDDLYITARTGGSFVPPVSTWDDKSFLAPNVYVSGTFAAATNQSILAFCDLGGDPNVPLWSDVPILIGYYNMHTAADPSYVEQTFCALEGGTHPINGTTNWGNQDGSHTLIPVGTYACIYFSPNTAPVFTEPTGPVTTDLTGCFAVSAVDNDGNLQTVTITGPNGFVATGTDFATGLFCPPSTGFYHFEATDGTDMSELDVEVVAIQGLDIQGDEGACVPAMPGATVPVDVTLHTLDFYCGGFELLVRWDPTALAYMNTSWLTRIWGGNEYHNTIMNPEGPGTIKFVWIADINNGVHQQPAAPAVGFGDALSFLRMNFQVASGLPFGMVIPISFEYTGDFRDNSVSDSTGYIFVVPGHSDGCVEIFDYTLLRGDPNMNCLYYEIADAVLVAQRLIDGLIVWTYDDADPASPTCTEAPFDRHDAAFNGAQEAAADLNNNGFADVGDLVWFINIINDIAFPPKLDPVTGTVSVALNNGAALISSGVEVGAVLMRVQGDITPVNDAMDMLVQKADGVTSVLIYSLAGERIPAGINTLFTYTGEGEIVEVSVSDVYGRLLDASARPILPTQFAVQQNYPNPFNAKTLINFDLPVQSDVSINIYNIAGQLVETLSGNYAAGHQQVVWDATGVSSGVYFAKVSTGDNTQTVKMTMLK